MGTITLESGNVLNSESFANLQNVASVLLNNGVLQTGSWANQNTLNGDYIGVLQTVATEPFTLQISFDTVAEVQALGVDYLAWVSAGIGAPDKVTYSASLDGKSWTELGTVAQEDARRYEAIATGMDAYHFVLETGAPVRVKYLKAEFERGFNTDKNTKFGWVAFDEFTVEGALTSEQPGPRVQRRWTVQQGSVLRQGWTQCRPARISRWSRWMRATRHMLLWRALSAMKMLTLRHLIFLCCWMAARCSRAAC